VYDPEKKEGHIELVENREAATLIPIIQRVVVPGRAMWSAFTACCASCSVRVWGGRGLPCVDCRLLAWLHLLLY